MKKITVIFFLLSVFIYSVSLSAEVSPSHVTRLKQLKSTILKWAPSCESDGIKWITKVEPGYGKICSSRITDTKAQLYQGDFDSTLFLGLLCSTRKEEWACRAVEASQDSTGRVYRSPRLKMMGNDYYYYTHSGPGVNKRSSFSRDMAAGVLLYLLSPDCPECKSFGNKWTGFIMKNGGICPKNENAGNLEVRSACYITPDLYFLYNQVADKVGFQKLKPGIMGEMGPVFNDIFNANKGQTGKLVMALIRWTQTHYISGKGAGYEMDLVGTNLLTYKLLGQWDGEMSKNAKTLYARNPMNAFFGYLAGESNDTLMNNIFTISPGENKPRLPNSWLWELDAIDNAANNKANQDLIRIMYVDTTSYGWDFIYIIDNLLP